MRSTILLRVAIILGFVYCCAFAPTIIQAWSLWPFSTAATENAKYLPNMETPDQYRRPCRFQSPITAKKAYRDVAKPTETENCRYELAKNLVDDMKLCSDQTTLSEFAKVATVCHYNMNGRSDKLPLSCNVGKCVNEMSQEVFQVYTAFYLHAEHICKLFFVSTRLQMLFD
jgi:hypothetical protein